MFLALWSVMGNYPSPDSMPQTRKQVLNAVVEVRLTGREPNLDLRTLERLGEVTPKMRPQDELRVCQRKRERGRRNEGVFQLERCLNDIYCVSDTSGQAS